LKENNEFKREVNNLSNKLERRYNSKVTFKHMLKTQRSFDEKSGLGFKKKMTKGERKRERKMKKLQQRKLSHTMCYRCHEADHIANARSYCKCMP
jgi:cytochrome c553